MGFRFSLPQRWPVYLLSAVIILLSLVTVIGERGALHLWRLQGEKNRLDEQNYKLQQENASLRQRLQKIRNDDHFLEKLAREELNMVLPGEVIYRFQSDPRRKSTAESSRSRPAEGQKARR